MTGFEFLEHTADLKFRARGSSLEEALANAARALKTVFVGEQVVEHVVEKSFEVSAGSLEDLLHDFLSELIFLFETEHFVAGEVSVTVDGKHHLSAGCMGAVLDLEKQKIESEVKAVTYHDMKIMETDGGWVIEVVCDI